MFCICWNFHIYPVVICNLKSCLYTIIAHTSHYIREVYTKNTTRGKRCIGTYFVWLVSTPMAVDFHFSIQWIPLAKGQLSGKCFHLMTSLNIQSFSDRSMWACCYIMCASLQTFLNDFSINIPSKDLRIRTKIQLTYYEKKGIWKWFTKR